MDYQGRTSEREQKIHEPLETRPTDDFQLHFTYSWDRNTVSILLFTLPHPS